MRSKPTSSTVISTLATGIFLITYWIVSLIMHRTPSAWRLVWFSIGIWLIHDSIYMARRGKFPSYWVVLSRNKIWFTTALILIGLALGILISLALW